MDYYFFFFLRGTRFDLKKLLCLLPSDPHPCRDCLVYLSPGAVVLMDKSLQPRLVPCAILAPLGSQQQWCTKELSPGLCRVIPSVRSSPQKASWLLLGREQLAKAASSARLMAKEQQQIMEIIFLKWPVMLQGAYSGFKVCRSLT